MKGKLCILAIVALFVCSYARAQSPGGDEHEWRIAMAFLKERGLDPQELQQGIAMETLVTFTDNKLRSYAVVVTKDYEKYIDNPVLAWGTGDELWKLSGRFQQYSDNNLLIWYDAKRLDRELEDGVLQKIGIPEFLKVPVRKMSGGMKKRLSIGCAVSNVPHVLLLDEPTAALDIACKNVIYEYLKDFKNHGGVILLATHDLHEIALCDACYVLKDGKLQEYAYDGDVQRLAELIG